MEQEKAKGAAIAAELEELRGELGITADGREEALDMLREQRMQIKNMCNRANELQSDKVRGVRAELASGGKGRWVLCASSVVEAMYGRGWWPHPIECCWTLCFFAYVACPVSVSSGAITLYFDWRVCESLGKRSSSVVYNMVASSQLRISAKLTLTSSVDDKYCVVWVCRSMDTSVCLVLGK